MKTQRHKGHREDGISPRNSVLSVPLCFKKISSDILERMGSTLLLGVEDMVRTVGRIASVLRNMLHSKQSTPSLSACIGSTEYPRQDSNRSKKPQGKRHVSKIVPPPVPPLASSVPPGASELVAIWSALDAHQQAELMRVARSMLDHPAAVDA